MWRRLRMPVRPCCVEIVLARLSFIYVYKCKKNLFVYNAFKDDAGTLAQLKQQICQCAVL